MLASILTMTKYYPTIWDEFSVPDGVDKDLAVKRICADCAELSLIYTQPDVLEDMISIWSGSNQYRWEEFYKTLSYKYDPVANVDAYEDEEETRDITNTSDRNKKGNTGSNSSSTLKQKTSKTGFDSSTLQQTDQEDTTGTGKDSGTYNETNDDTDKQKGTIKHSLHRYGNIGVVSAQKLIQEQRELINVSMYENISNSFKNEFCVRVY